jgi:hypothetical protein
MIRGRKEWMEMEGKSLRMELRGRLRRKGTIGRTITFLREWKFREKRKELRGGLKGLRKSKVIERKTISVGKGEMIHRKYVSGEETEEN